MDTVGSKDSQNSKKLAKNDEKSNSNGKLDISRNNPPGKLVNNSVLFHVRHRLMFLRFGHNIN